MCEIYKTRHSLKFCMLMTYGGGGGERDEQNVTTIFRNIFIIWLFILLLSLLNFVRHCFRLGQSIPLPLIFSS